MSYINNSLLLKMSSIEGMELFSKLIFGKISLKLIFVKISLKLVSLFTIGLLFLKWLLKIF